MDANDFCYWLQGHFELLDGPAKDWDENQSKVFSENLALGLASSSKSSRKGRADGFCNWLDGYASAALDLGGGALESKVVAKIQSRLDQVFEHALAPVSPKADAGRSGGLEVLC